jgi:Arm domain-containing DNA-binding protein
MRESNRLTAIKVSKLSKPGRYADGHGLWLQVSKWGPKSWVLRYMRDDFAIPTAQLVGPRFDELGADIRSDLSDDFDVLAQQHNPIVRRVVRRTRPMLEEKG